MKTIFEIQQERLLKKEEQNKIRSERASIIKLFLERLNLERIGSTYKPLTGGFVSMMMPKVKFKTNGDLYTFFCQCKDAKNFSKYWWWSLKLKDGVIKKL